VRQEVTVPAADAAYRPDDRRWSRRRGLTVLLVLAVALAPIAWIGLLRGTGAADGTLTIANSPPGWSAGGIRVAEVVGQPGDLRPGDVVVGMDGVPAGAWTSTPPGLRLRVGDHVAYQVLRDGRPDTVDVTLIDYPFAAKTVQHITGLMLLLLLLGVGAFVFLNRPADRAARVLLGLTGLAPLTSTTWPLGMQVFDLANGPRAWPLMLGDAATMVLWSTMLWFTLIFPEPRGGRGGRRMALVVFLLPAVLYGGYLAFTLPGHTDPLTRWQHLSSLSLASAPVFPFLIAGAVGWQFSAARDVETRRRLRWVFGSMVLTVGLYVGLGQLPDRLVGHPLVPWDWVAVFFAPFPVVLGFAILRYRLFDIQVILRRSLVYATLTVALAAVYVVVVGTLDQLSTGLGNLAPLLATAVVTVSFQPLRVRLQRLVSHLMFGDRDDPYLALSHLGAQLESSAAVDSVLDATVTTLAETLRLSYAGIELVRGDALVLVADIGTPTSHAARVALVHRGEEVGMLVLDAGPSREPFGPADRHLLDGLARQIAMTAQNVELTARLRQSLGQVVSAREEERRRLRRDIHDGIGPMLASASIHVDLVRRFLRRDPDQAATVLTTLAQTQQTLITDLHRLVDGLRPPVLDHLGLVAALRQRSTQFAADGRLEVTVDADGDIEPLPAAVEVAALHIVLESLTNVVRHANARRCGVRLRREPASLRIDIDDDGRGLPTAYRAGVGLASIRERAAQLGGTASITAGTGGGTSVHAVLPLPPA
jgi:two-component system, NarL family, sensor kinase